ncbi:hypothetical protein AAE02nite_22160 [Adhaeribacter aerolatus]|uniref:DUF481 domain-containing protein n=1 Tax=Adhaeribacter aerolatus TaxID=670289 RepID=A0A512AXV6_9BACT|nr:DUF481 domain-containing protein [Adhaeribacter aerolatus]GEO04552.1 hypothetical protein AAE02nite_22160 [Adhaeribacter aerolatus]
MISLKPIAFAALFCFFFSFFNPFAFAQQPTPPPGLPVSTTDSLRQAEVYNLARQSFVLFDSLNYRFIGDGNLTRGNINRTLVVTRAEIIVNGPVVSLSTNPRFAYGKQNHVLAERDAYIDLFIDIYKQKRVYGFSLATLENSNLRGINLRQLAGIGVGLRLLRKSNHTLSFTNAVIHESTNFRSRPTITIQRNSARLKGSHTFLQNKIRFNHITFVQPALSDFSNLRWNTVVSLELPLTKWVTIRTAFENTYESVVDPNRKKNDTRLTAGIAVGNRP